ncbi:MAG: hypothetical protein KC731_27860, partial [Myxococcales bacterium]|nr:hypothetical protein [Myxococcales bacterium]
ACMKRTMQIHMLVSYENLVGPGGALWYHGLTAEALERHWLTIPLDRPPNQPRSLADRQAAVAFVDSLVQNITSSQPEDAPYYRRLYLGGLLACHAKESALHLIGGQRQTGCIDLDGALRAQRLTTPSSKPPVHPPSPSRGSSGVLDPWNSGRPNAPTRPRAPRPAPELKDPWQSGKDPLQRRK